MNERSIGFIEEDEEEERIGMGPFKVCSQVIGIGLFSKKDLKRIKA